MHLLISKCVYIFLTIHLVTYNISIDIVFRLPFDVIILKVKICFFIFHIIATVLEHVCMFIVQCSHIKKVQCSHITKVQCSHITKVEVSVINISFDDLLDLKFFKVWTWK